MINEKNAVVIGTAANELSKKITGTSETSVVRTTVAVGTGAAMGAVASGAVVVGATALGVATAPITVPLAVGSAVVAGFLSLFD